MYRLEWHKWHSCLCDFIQFPFSFRDTGHHKLFSQYGGSLSHFKGCGVL